MTTYSRGPRTLDPKRCQETVDHRDTFRRTGRGPTGFELNYTIEQCKRLRKTPTGYCKQHGRRYGE